MASDPLTLTPKTRPPYRPPLRVHVVWHPASRRGARYANLLYSWLTRDVRQPTSRRLGVPVHFRSAPAAAGERLPLPIDLERARHSAVIALVDDAMILDDDWAGYLRDLWRQTSSPGSPHRIFPVSLSAWAFQIDRTVAENNFIRLHDLPRRARAGRLVLEVTHELCRMLLGRPRVGEAAAERSPAPVSLFLSHAKADGEHHARGLKAHVDAELPLKTFFDANDIARGYGFGDEIRGVIRAGDVVVAFRTDAYASRPWCREEVLAAKLSGAPLVVVDALTRREERGFPYLGNAPTLRWDPARPAAAQRDAIVRLALYTALGDVHFRRHLANLCAALAVDGEPVILPRPPELLSCLDLPRDALVVYPDPPLGDEELRVLGRLRGDLVFRTPTLLAASAPARSAP